MKPDLTVKRFYEALEEDKIMGRQCRDCGNVEWPPVYSCNECGGHHTDWIEMSGEAEVVEFVPARGLLVQIKELMPYAVGHVRLKEGPVVSDIIQGISLDNAQDVRDRLPVPVKAKIIKMPAGYSRVVFEMTEQG
jgi:uncharacterized OB-fold protein